MRAHTDPGSAAAAGPGTYALFILLAVLMVAAMVTLLSVEDQVSLKRLIEDDGPVQFFGQSAIALAFFMALFYTVADKARRRSYLYLSYLLMFYTLREADYHYKLSEHAKATQFKRFFGHDMIPLTSKLFLFAIVVLFLIVFVTYLREHRETFKTALLQRLPWALMTAAWGVVFFLSQAVDQIPWFHNVTGQVFEEIFESSAEAIALIAMVLFRWHVNHWEGMAPSISPSAGRG
jgi:hypothetical protein